MTATSTETDVSLEAGGKPAMNPWEWNQLDRKCGRPTKTGRPCRADRYSCLPGCKLHVTPEEVRLGEVYQRGVNDGRRESSGEWSRGHAMGVEHGRKVAAREQAELANMRYEIGGHKIVQVGGYAYLWTGREPLAIGDRVLLPENWLGRIKHGPGATVGTVTGFGSTYTGEFAHILKRMEAARAE